MATRTNRLHEQMEQDESIEAERFPVDFFQEGRKIARLSMMMSFARREQA